MERRHHRHLEVAGEVARPDAAETRDADFGVAGDFGGVAKYSIGTRFQGFFQDDWKLTDRLTINLGLRYEISSLFNARLELAHRVLFTDYLDDVSRDYIDPNLFANYLPANLARVAERLYSRKGELNPSDQTFIGDGRGDPRDNDAFFTIQFKLGVTLGRRQR